MGFGQGVGECAGSEDGVAGCRVDVCGECGVGVVLKVWYI